MKAILEAIKKAKFNYTSHSTGYFETTIYNNLCQIIWSKDESYSFNVDEFSVFRNGKWQQEKPTPEQKELMKSMLNDVQDRKEEYFTDPDDYFNCGVRRENFY